VGEVGGGNGLEPVIIGLRLDLPIVDADLMVRSEGHSRACGRGVVRVRIVQVLCWLRRERDVHE
jgi:hypothetical protein